MKTPFLRWILAATALTSLCLGVAHAQVDTSKSTVTATSKQMNVPVDGTFKKFTAQLNFDPAKPAAGSAKLSIDTASYDLGDESYNQQVRGKEWFDAAQFPNATFVSSAIAPAGGNQFKVSGTLTIKGKSENVTVPVTVAQQGTTQSFDGALPIKRSQFDIGTGEWKDTSVVADEVVIKFHIVAAKK
ncbi:MULTISPECIES: YceI family protein [Paraburkholderia]|jgi:polyisoprenoid-binding protein YceI|uniref:Polyisoprenoid-binding protein YceI n=1 Tax=Paraburkholderia phenazinium TaxID=60549 RepID=A0A1N6FI08_9BURK|nr:YceI family protein [Paraburkholderia phenazinium]SIN94836.1 Polyisoprenoid-binding protein YceI [Paraburkholderia phenazinium]